MVIVPTIMCKHLVAVTTEAKTFCFKEKSRERERVNSPYNFRFSAGKVYILIEGEIWDSMHTCMADLL